MKSTLSLPDINREWRSPVWFYVAVAWFREAFRACKNLCCRESQQSPPTVGLGECMVSLNVTHSGKALHLDTGLSCTYSYY